jgi:hypothetical protein
MEKVKHIVFREYEYEVTKDIIEYAFDATIYFERDDADKAFIFSVNEFADCAAMLDKLDVDFYVFDKDGRLIEARITKSKESE